MPQADWGRIEELFARACDLPVAARAAFVDSASEGDADLREEVLDLLRAHEEATGFFATSPGSPGEASDQTAPLLHGAQFGVWRVVELIGRGGMGEVYAVERADGAFAQRGALKLLRREANEHIERFHTERAILARLAHPGIASLLDGGITEDGRPWAVLEFVAGLDIVDWCLVHAAGRVQRLELFVQVCDAVAYAHRNLIVHRDIKPSNILVDEAARARLLDFGIAKLLDRGAWGGGAATSATQAPLTPDYCAPEQLAGESVTTATDIYLLGLLLFELLTGTRPWRLKGLPLARAMRTLLDVPAPAPSGAAAAHAGSPVPARELRGDLDAIVARCLRKEPAHRYATVDALKLDIERHLRGQAVAARGGARAYLLGRFLRRHRWAVAGVGAVLVTLAAGVAAFAWQARRAQAQAERAEATKNFLIDVFAANDPRKAQDRPRGEISARDLLDIGATRIEKYFAGKPELQIELLGVTAQIYSEIGEQERYAAQHRRYVELARGFYGDAHPIAIDALLQEANYQSERPNEAEALRVLDEVDPLIRRAGLDETPTRALWWKIRGTTLYADAARKAEDEDAWRHAIELYARTDPHDQHYPDALMVLANLENKVHERPDRGLALLQRARDAQLQARDADDTDLAMIDDNIAGAQRALGDFAAADAAMVRAIDGYRRTWGETSQAYFGSLAVRAQLHCENGDRDSAMRLFDPLLAMLVTPDNPGIQAAALGIRATYGICLAWIGRSDAAVAILEAVERERPALKGSPRSIARDRIALGDAYDRVGRFPDARRSLKEGLDDRTRQDPEDSPRLLESRERWGRFLLTQGDAAGALAAFHETIAQDHGRNLAFTALAHAGLAREALQRHDAAAALVSSREALRVFEHVTGPRNARMQPYLWRVHAMALAFAGSRVEALGFAQRALAAFEQYDDPASAEIAEARATVEASSKP